MAIQHAKNEQWPEIADALDRKYRGREKSPRYFHRQKFNRDTFLQPCTPYNQVFFGTKSYHILIINRPYNLEDEVFLESIIESKTIIRRNYQKFQRYWVDIWVDYTVADRIAAVNDELKGKLEDVARFCSDLCNDMSDCGFIYKGEITADMNVDANFFDSFIQEFWKQQQLPT